MELDKTHPESGLRYGIDVSVAHSLYFGSWACQCGEKVRSMTACETRPEAFSRAEANYLTHHAFQHDSHTKKPVG